METQRLNTTIASRLGVSRRHADKLIAEGLVSVNGSAANLGVRVSESDSIVVSGKALPAEKPSVTILLHKPVGFVSSRTQQGSAPTIYSLLPPKFHELKPAGRLDKDSSGLMLLSSDGQLIYRLTHPSLEKVKRYQVTLDKPLSEHNKALIEHGVQLDDGVSKLHLKGRDTQWEISMHEGRNRQIRRTFAAIDIHVIRLHRTHLGDYKLDPNLAPGKWTVLPS